MRANWSINTAARFVVLHDHLMHSFAHAVQTLKFVRLWVSRHMQDGCHCMGIVGRELRIDAIRHVQKFTCICDIANIGLCLLSKDRKMLHAQNLGLFDFGVPVGTFDQAHHELAVIFDRHVIQCLDRGFGAWAVSLDNNAKPIPASKSGF